MHDCWYQRHINCKSLSQFDAVASPVCVVYEEAETHALVGRTKQNKRFILTNWARGDRAVSKQSLSWVLFFQWLI